MLEFACLPFGLASAPRVFTKLMKPVVALFLTAGHSANNLFRRHINYGRILRPSASSGSFSIESPREFRFHSKL